MTRGMGGGKGGGAAKTWLASQSTGGHAPKVVMRTRAEVPARPPASNASAGARGAVGSGSPGKRPDARGAVHQSPQQNKSTKSTGVRHNSSVLPLHIAVTCG